jgi:hypothetical protein
MSIQTKLQTTERMTGASFTTLQSAFSGWESFRTQVQSLNTKKLTARERTQLSSKVKKQMDQLAQAFTSQLGAINSKLSQAEREHSIKTKPSTSDFNYLPLLANKNVSQLTDLGNKSATAAKLLAAEPGLFNLSPELANSMSRAASPETYDEIDRLDVEAVRVEQLQASAMKEASTWAMAYETNAETEATAAFLGDSGEGGEL